MAENLPIKLLKRWDVYLQRDVDIKIWTKSSPIIPKYLFHSTKARKNLYKPTIEYVSPSYRVNMSLCKQLILTSKQKHTLSTVQWVSWFDPIRALCTWGGQRTLTLTQFLSTLTGTLSLNSAVNRRKLKHRCYLFVVKKTKTTQSKALVNKSRLHFSTL